MPSVSWFLQGPKTEELEGWVGRKFIFLEKFSEKTRAYMCRAPEFLYLFA